MQRHHILALVDNSVFIKEIFDELSKEDLKNLISKEFNNKVSFFELIGNRLYQIHKGKDITFGLNNYLNVEVGLFMLADKYPLFLQSKDFLILMMDYDINYNGYLQDIENIKNEVSKPIVIDKWKHKINFMKFYDALNIDPTHNQKYLNWICSVMYNFEIANEDFDKVRTLLEDFDNPQVKSLIKKSGYSIDIMDYENNNDLWKIINECYYSKLEDIEAGDRQILYQKRKVFENNKWLVVIPENHPEAVTLGRGTNWCTSADSEDGAENFKNYTTNVDSDSDAKIHDLFIFINKQNEKEKFQYSANVIESFLDWEDEDFNAKEVFDFETVEEYHNTMEFIPTQFKEILYLNDKEKYLDYIIYVEDDATAFEDKKELIKQGKLLDVLFRDKSVYVKLQLVYAGYYLEEFKNNPHYLLRVAVAKEGYALDELAQDAAGLVRAEVARQGYNIENFLNDEDKTVRAIAKHFSNLSILGKAFYMVNDYGFEVLDTQSTFKGEVYID